jgi:hypothetical protein
MNRDKLADNIPNSAMGIFLPFFISVRSDTMNDNSNELEEYIINVEPLICNPNSSYETSHPVLHQRSQLPSFNWSPKLHQVTGYSVMIHFSDQGPENREDSKQKYPVCALTNLERVYGIFSSPHMDDLASLQHIVTKASQEALKEEVNNDIIGNLEECSKQRKSNDKSLDLILKSGLHVSMISTLRIIAQVLSKSRLKYFADALFAEVEDQHKEASSNDKSSYPWQLCSPDGPLKHNDYIRTLILIQVLTKLRVHVKHFTDYCDYTAQTLAAMGCLQNENSPKVPGCSNSKDHDVIYQIKVPCRYNYDTMRPKLLQSTYFTIHEKGAENLIHDDKLFHAKSLSDIVANINTKTYYEDYMRCIKDCADGLTNNIHIHVRNHLPLPAGELGNMAEKVLTNDAINACIGTQYLVGHQMLQMIMYYLYDVIQDGSIFPSLKFFVLSYGEGKTEGSPDTTCMEGENIVEHIYNMSKEYSTPSADSTLGRLLEAYNVSSGSNQFQQWSSDYCSHDSKSNKSYVFDSNEKLLASDIPLPMNNFLCGNFTWSESMFNDIASRLRSSQAAQWKRQNTSQMMFLVRFCFTNSHRNNILSFLEKRKANGKFNDSLFTNVMNICYTACLRTTWKWCEKQTNSTFGQLWNTYRFKRQLKSLDEVDSRLPDIQCQDLKFGLQLIVGMKMILLLPQWLTDIVDDEECIKKCAQIYDTCHVFLSRSTKNVPYKSFITNWNFSQSEFDSFDANERNGYNHLTVMLSFMCAFHSCLTSLKTDDWRECKSEERQCISAYPKHSNCTTFPSLIGAFYKYIKIILACPFDGSKQKGVTCDDEDHKKNPLKFLLLHFCDTTLELINGLNDGENATMLMGRLNLRKIPSAVSDLDLINTDDKIQTDKKKGRGNGSRTKNSAQSTFTIDTILQMIKDHVTSGSDSTAMLPKIDGQEVVPLADVKNAILLCCSNSVNDDGSITIIATKNAADHKRDEKPNANHAVLEKKGSRKVRSNDIINSSIKKRRHDDNILERESDGSKRLDLLAYAFDNKGAESGTNKGGSAKEWSGNKVVEKVRPKDRKKVRSATKNEVKSLTPARTSRETLERFDKKHTKLSDSTNRTGLFAVFDDVDPLAYDI